VKNRTKLILLILLFITGFVTGYNIKFQSLSDEKDYLREVTTRLVVESTKDQVIIQNLDYQLNQCRLLYRGQ
jgi:hypothetical protein